MDAFKPGLYHRFVFSSDGKTLVFDVGRSAEIVDFQAHDPRIRRRLGEDIDAARRASAIAVDPTSQVVASAGLDNYIRLSTL